MKNSIINLKAPLDIRPFEERDLKDPWFKKEYETYYEGTSLINLTSFHQLLLTQPNEYSLNVAVCGDNIIGYVGGNKERGRLACIKVRVEYRRNWIGANLVQHFISTSQLVDLHFTDIAMPYSEELTKFLVGLNFTHERDQCGISSFDLVDNTLVNEYQMVDHMSWRGDYIVKTKSDCIAIIQRQLASVKGLI